MAAILQEEKRDLTKDGSGSSKEIIEEVTKLDEAPIQEMV